MRTFRQFAVEYESFDIESLKQDCAFFLKLISGTRGKDILFRGGKDTPDDFEIRTWKPRDKPRNTPVEAHDVYNSFFKDRFGHEFRNWMFCTGDPDQAAAYSIDQKSSNNTAIFPIGQFEWFCGFDPILRDLTISTKNEVNKIIDADVTQSISPSERHVLAANSVIKQVKPNDWNFNSNLVDCIRSNNEIMFRCENYYAFNVTGPTFKSAKFKKFLASL